MHRIRSLPIRARIALTILVVSTTLLVAMSLAVYTTFARQLSDNLDDTLRLRAAANLNFVDTASAPPALAFRPEVVRERVEGAAVLRLYSSSGQLLADGSPAAASAAGEHELVQAAIQQRSELLRSVNMANEERFRLLAHPLQRDGAVGGVLVTGIELGQVAEPLAILRFILIVAVPLTGIVLGVSGFLIARSALRPVAAITATAQRIAAGDLRQRMPPVGSHDEVGDLAATFNTMIGRLADTLDRERRFTADASHELRTPLTAIATSIEVTLQQTRSADEYRAALEAVRLQAHRLTRLTRQLLLLARLDADAVTSQFEAVDLCVLSEAIAETFREEHPDAHVSVVTPAEPVMVRGDVELLARALSNLLENAATHAGPRVAVVVSVEARDGETVLRIEDDGPGIPPGLLPTVLQRFRRGDDSGGRGGSGLGLAIVEAITQAHGGAVQIAGTARGTGTAVEIRLPSGGAS
ncbi:MAG: HAMP domain-containing protein [Dehalococcoidia bacterium]|nr:MAG: HAMP domain-containing protein [Dehalococcoidia bacterium]